MDIQELFSLKDKVIVVTGGTGVLGGAFVKGIANAGGIPVILGRNATVAEQRAKEIINNGGKAMAVVANVLDETELVKAKNSILEKYGTIDGLVNGAGGNLPEGVLHPDADIFSMNIDKKHLDNLLPFCSRHQGIPIKFGCVHLDCSYCILLCPSHLLVYFLS